MYLILVYFLRHDNPSIIEETAKQQFKKLNSCQQHISKTIKSKGHSREVSGMSGMLFTALGTI